jgi:flagellar biogenesis protein FliO
VVGFLTYQVPSTKDTRDSTEIFGASFSSMFLVPALMLFVGWIVQHWM